MVSPVRSRVAQAERRLMPLLEIQGGHLSDRVHPGSVARWHGSPVEWHSRYLLYLDTLEYEKQFDLLYDNAVLLSEEISQIHRTVGAMAELQASAPRHRASPPSVSEQYTGELSG